MAVRPSCRLAHQTEPAQLGAATVAELRARQIQRTMAQGLESGSIDVAMGPYLDTAPGLVQRSLFSEDFVCVVRRDHPGVRATLDLDTYCALPHALFSPRGEGTGRADAALAALGRERRVVLRVPHLLTAMLLVIRTDVVLTTPRRIVSDFPDIWPVRVLEPPLKLSRFDVIMLWHERYQRDPAHAWLRRMIVAVSEDIAAAPAARRAEPARGRRIRTAQDTRSTQTRRGATASPRTR